MCDKPVIYHWISYICLHCPRVILAHSWSVSWFTDIAAFTIPLILSIFDLLVTIKRYRFSRLLKPRYIMAKYDGMISMWLLTLAHAG